MYFGRYEKTLSPNIVFLHGKQRSIMGYEIQSSMLPKSTARKRHSKIFIENLAEPFLKRSAQKYWVKSLGFTNRNETKKPKRQLSIKKSPKRI